MDAPFAICFIMAKAEKKRDMVTSALVFKYFFLEVICATATYNFIGQSQ